MTSARTSVHAGLAGRAGPGSARWLAVGRSATLVGLALGVLVQWISDDWFPPDISVSQYGVGPRGWVFSCWTAVLAVAMLALTLGSPAMAPRATFRARCWVATGIAGLLVMGIVRTDAGGAQHSWHAKLHMTGSIMASLAMPVGIVLALGWARRPWRRTAVALTAVSAAALLLVLASALGLPTLGMDAQHSWAFWQSVAVTVDLLLVGVFALAGAVGRDAEAVRAGPR